MQLKVLVDINASFYFWVQAVSGWDKIHIDKTVYNYFTENIPPELTQTRKLIGEQLLTLDNPREILGDLYSGTISLQSAKNIATSAEIMRPYFESSILPEALPYLKKCRDNLETSINARLSQPLQEIAKFLGSSTDQNRIQPIHLGINKPNGSAWGLSINGYDFIMVFPSTKDKGALNNTLCIVAHEYIHILERKSRKSRELQEFFISRMNSSKALPPQTYTWGSLYREIIALSFSNPTTGGYLRPELYDKPRPSLDEMEEGFWKIVKERRYTTGHVLSWVALHVLPDIDRYIAGDMQLNEDIITTMCDTLIDFYGKHRTLDGSMQS